MARMPLIQATLRDACHRVCLPTNDPIVPMGLPHRHLGHNAGFPEASGWSLSNGLASAPSTSETRNALATGESATAKVENCHHFTPPVPCFGVSVRVNRSHCLPG